MPVTRMPRVNRKQIAQTGLIPEGLELLQDDYPLEICDSKKVLTESVSGKKVPAMRLTGVFQRADERNANGRIYPEDVLREAIADMQDAVKARSVMGEYDHPCLTFSSLRNAKVLTTDGWKPYDQVEVGDYVYSRVDGKMVPSRVNAIIDEDYDGEVYALKGRHIDATVTAPHKMLLDTRGDGEHKSKQIEVTARELFENRAAYNKCRIPRVAEWHGRDEGVYVIPGISKQELSRSVKYYNNDVTDDLQLDVKTFVSFLGLYLAEGSLASSGYGILLHQVKEDYKPQIREMLRGFPAGLQWSELDKAFYLSDARLYRYLEKLGNKYDKFIPKDVKKLDGIFLEELVYWFQMGDGRLKHGRSNVFSTSKRLIDDLHECWVKAGHCCYYTEVITEGDYEFAGHVIKAQDKKPLHQLTLSHTTGIYCDDRFLQMTSKQVKERIWCLTTEHGSFLIENNGCSFWTGNCDAKIHMERVSHLITKLWMEGKTVYGEIEVINDPRCPLGSQLECMIERRIQVGISSRGVGEMEMTMDEGQDAYLVQPGFSFVTFDAVAEPSVKGTQLAIAESRNRMVNTRRDRAIREQLLRRAISEYLYEAI